MIFAFIALECVKRYVDIKHYKSLIITLTTTSLFLIVALVAFALTNNFHMAVGTYFAVAMLRSIKSPLTSAWLNQNLQSETRATIFSMQQQADGFGQMGGGPLLDVIGKYVAVSTALVYAAVALVPALGLYASSYLRSKPNKAPNSKP